jgi:hypothetical protein
MKRAAIIALAVLCCSVMAFAQGATSKKLPSVAGNWDVTVKLPGANQSEQWTIQQTGDKVTGTAKGSRGELKFEGTIDDVGFFRVDMKDGDTVIKVRATLDVNDLDGSITIGKDEHLWAAKRKK